MTTRRTGWIVGAVAVALVLSMIAPGAVLVLAVPVAIIWSLLTRRRPTGHEDRDVAERLLAAVTGERTSSDGEQVDWGAALRAELATITVPRERRRFAVRVGLGDDGLGSVTLLLPPVMLFAIGYLCARSIRSLRFGLETGIVAALTTLVAVAVVYGVEAAHWYHVAPMSASSTANTSTSTRPGQPSWARCIRSSFLSTSCSGRPGRSWAPGPGREHRGPPAADA